MVAMQDILKPGGRVRIIRQLPQRDQCWTPRVEGTLVSLRQEPTGAWFAHSKNHKLWLDRAMVRMDDGELTDCVLDEYTRVEPLQGAVPAELLAVDSAAAATVTFDVGKWRWPAAFVTILAVGALALAIAMMSLRLVGVGALCFFALFMWTSLPALVALESAAVHQFGPVARKLLVATSRESVETVAGIGSACARPSHGILQERAAHRPHRRVSSTHKGTTTRGLMP